MNTPPLPQVNLEIRRALAKLHKQAVRYVNGGRCLVTNSNLAYARRLAQVIPITAVQWKAQYGHDLPRALNAWSFLGRLRHHRLIYWRIDVSPATSRMSLAHELDHIQNPGHIENGAPPFTLTTGPEALALIRLGISAKWNRTITPWLSPLERAADYYARLVAIDDLLFQADIRQAPLTACRQLYGVRVLDILRKLHDVMPDAPLCAFLFSYDTARMRLNRSYASFDMPLNADSDLIDIASFIRYRYTFDVRALRDLNVRECLDTELVRGHAFQLHVSHLPFGSGGLLAVLVADRSVALGPCGGLFQ